MKAGRGFGQVLAAAAVTALLVLGFPLAASAASWNLYFDGSSSQNQTLSSGTKQMSGGRAQVLVLTTYAQVTQVGVGTQSGGSTATLTHALVSTSSYCQWKSTSAHQPKKYALQCWYER